MDTQKQDALSSLAHNTHQTDAPSTAVNTATESGGSRAPLFFMLSIAAFVLIFLIATWRQWMPVVSVEVTRVVAMPAAYSSGTATLTKQTNANTPAAAQNQSQAKPAFQAAGWVEADPQVTQITALVSGVITHVNVVDGQAVTQGQEIAALDKADYQFALRLAENEVAAKQALLQAAQQQSAVAQANIAAHAKHHEVADAVSAEKQDVMERLNNAADSVSQGRLNQARLEHKTAQTRVEAVYTEHQIYQATLLEKQAQEKVASAHLETAESKRDQAQLNLDRCIIRAPMDGMIQELFASPGRKQMLGSDNMHSTTVATIYDPLKLQVRVDVALDDASGLFIGQETKINCSALPGKTFIGTVTRLLGVADISRNTIQAKVRIHNPVPLLRPDMLVKVQFLGQPSAANSSSATNSGEIGNSNSATLQCYLLTDALTNNGSTSALSVWVVNDDERIEKRSISIGARKDQYTEVTSGLRPGEWVVMNPPTDLEENQRVLVLQSAHTEERTHD